MLYSAVKVPALPLPLSFSLSIMLFLLHMAMMMMLMITKLFVASGGGGLRLWTGVYFVHVVC